MKIGVICECGPQGAEVQVFPEIIRKLGLHHVLDIVPLDIVPLDMLSFSLSPRDFMENGILH